MDTLGKGRDAGDYADPKLRTGHLALSREFSGFIVV